MEQLENDDHREDAHAARMRISCDEDGALQFQLPDGQPVTDDLREAAIIDNRIAIIDLLERTAVASQSLLRLGEHQPAAAFRQRTGAPVADIGPDPPEPSEPDLPRMPKRKLVHWLLPPLWRPVREKVTRDHLQARQVYLWQHEVWRKTVEEKQAERAGTQARTKAANKADEARFLQRQLRIVKGTDPAAAADSFAEQLRVSPGRRCCASTPTSATAAAWRHSRSPCRRSRNSNRSVRRRVRSMRRHCACISTNSLRVNSSAATICS